MQEGGEERKGGAGRFCATCLKEEEGLLESGRGKETNSPLRPLEGSLPRDHGIGVET